MLIWATETEINRAISCTTLVSKCFKLVHIFNINNYGCGSHSFRRGKSHSKGQRYFTSHHDLIDGLCICIEYSQYD